MTWHIRNGTKGKLTPIVHIMKSDKLETNVSYISATLHERQRKAYIFMPFKL